MNFGINASKAVSRLGSLLCAFFATLLLTAWQPSLKAATLITDKPDYIPGETVTFSGSGWTAGETVTIDVWEISLDPDLQITPILSAIADSDGNITNSEFQVIQSYLNQGFAAYATGELSGFTATTTFTDSSIEDFSQ